uniref:Orf201 n=1 Tax=Phytophthora cinnamomi TaxID=4785 RepID=G9CUM4_PHYCI|nr:orf201 [Phytophthora cinnamomi]AEV52399.1 orf201 [Phytophthora cinnamomi]AEV52404.1 orf201 [Phytophthora cinnamomi]
MKKMYKIIILIFLTIFINCEEQNITNCEEQNITNCEEQNITNCEEQNITNCEEQNITNCEEQNITKKILIISSLILLSLLLLFFFFYSNESLNYNIDELYKISVEISNNCTVKGWETIHQILKDMDPTSATKNKNIVHQILKNINLPPIDINNLIQILENLIQMDKDTPNIYSVNSYLFEKSVNKLIKFLKNI